MSQGKRRWPLCTCRRDSTSVQERKGDSKSNTTQADQKITPSPLLKAVCSSLDQMADGQLRKYNHTSSAADIPLFWHKRYKNCWKISFELREVHTLSCFKKECISGRRQKKKSYLYFKLLLRGAAFAPVCKPLLWELQEKIEREAAVVVAGRLL